MARKTKRIGKPKKTIKTRKRKQRKTVKNKTRKIKKRKNNKENILSTDIYMEFAKFIKKLKRKDTKK